MNRWIRGGLAVPALVVVLLGCGGEATMSADEPLVDDVFDSTQQEVTCSPRMTRFPSLYSDITISKWASPFSSSSGLSTYHM